MFVVGHPVCFAIALANCSTTFKYDHQMGMGMGGAGQVGFDAAGAYKMEKEALGIVRHQWIGDRAEKFLLGDRYPELHSGAAVDLSNFK